MSNRHVSLALSGEDSDSEMASPTREVKSFSRPSERPNPLFYHITHRGSEAEGSMGSKYRSWTKKKDGDRGLGRTSVSFGGLVDESSYCDDDEEMKSTNLNVSAETMPNQVNNSDLAASTMHLSEKPRLKIVNQLGFLSQSLAMARNLIRGENCNYNLKVNALFCLGPENSFRRNMFLIVDHVNFERLVLTIITLNTVFLILDTPGISEIDGMKTAVNVAEYVFQSLFTIEMMMKSVALGFILHEHSYLRSGWNQVDFVIVILGFVGFFVNSNFSSIRLIRVLRPLKAVSKVPELAALVGALLSSMPRMRDVFVLMLFVLLIFAILGLQLFVGQMHQRCYFYQNVTTNVSGVLGWAMQPTLYPLDQNYCSTGTSAGHQCPDGTFCGVYKDVFKHKTKHFDNIGNSLVYVFKIVSMDNWPQDLAVIQHVGGTGYFIYVFIVVLFGSFFTINLILAILSSEYEIATKEAEEKSREEAALIQPEEDGEDDVVDDFDPEEPGSPLSPLPPAANTDDSANRWARAPEENSPDQPQDMAAVIKVIELARGLKKGKRKKKKDESCLQMLRRIMLAIALSTSFNAFMFFITILNVLVLAIDHHGINSTLELVLNWINFTCSLIFIVEFVIKFVGMGTTYFEDGFNRFDFILVVISIPEMAIAGSGSGSAFSALRAFRLARVFRVVKTSKKIQLLLMTVIKAAAGAAYLFLLLLLFLLITALTGVNLLSNSYEPGVRPNFNNLGDALLAVFIIITGENWFDVTENGMNGSHWTIIFYFLFLFCIGNFIVLNLFVAILIGSFANASESALEEEDEKEEEKEKRLKRELEDEEREKAEEEMGNKNEEGMTPQEDDEGAVGRKSVVAFTLPLPDPDQLASAVAQEPGNEEGETVQPMQEGNNGDQFYVHHSWKQKNSFMTILGKVLKKRHKERRKKEIVSFMNSTPKSPLSPGYGTPAHHPMTPGSPTFSQIGTPYDENGQVDYSEVLLGKSFKCFDHTSCLRIGCAKIVSHPIFEYFILFMIVASCIMLGFDNPEDTKNDTIVTALMVTDWIFLVVFFLESLLHCIAWGMFLGEGAYLSDSWNRLDAAVVVASVVGIFFPVAQMLRSLRSFKLGAKFESLRIVISAMFHALPVVANVVVLLLFGLLVFSILGVSLFKGMFVYCTDSTILARTDCVGNYTTVEPNYQMVNGTLVVNSTTVTHARSWEHSFFNFNHLGNALLSLATLSLSDGWSVLLWDAMDSRNYDEAMQPYSRSYMGLYVLIFVIFGTFFMMNLFIGSLIDAFQKERDKKEGRIDEHGAPMLTESQSEWLRTYKVAKAVKLLRHPPAPINAFRKWCCDLYFADEHRIVTDNTFEWVITICIIINTLFMCVQYDGMPNGLERTLWWINLTFAVIYVFEAAIKMTALMPYAYFNDGWNRFDFMLIPLAFIALFVGGPGTNAVRVLRVARVLRLIKRADGLQRLFNSLMYALPQLMNITLMLLLTIFIFGVLGVSICGEVITQPEYPNSKFTEFFNFKHAGKAMLVLFQISTTEGWSDVMQSCMAKPETSGCSHELGNCGSGWAVPYFILFMIAANAVTLNLFIFVIVDNYLEVQSLANDKPVLAAAALEHFRNEWAMQDIECTEMLHWKQLLVILQKLPPEFGFSDPNSPVKYGTNLVLTKALRRMDVLIDHHGQVMYLDCVQGVTRFIFGLDVTSTRSAAQLIAADGGDDEDLEHYENCFKVHHAIAAMRLIDILRRKVSERRTLDQARQEFRERGRQRHPESPLSPGRPGEDVFSQGDPDSPYKIASARGGPESPLSIDSPPNPRRSSLKWKG